MTDQINKMNFISGETFEGKTFDPSEINFVDVTDDILPALNASERFTPRYGLEFSSSTNMNIPYGNYVQNGVVSSTSVKKYVLSPVTYETEDILELEYNQDGSFNLTDLTGSYAIMPFNPNYGTIHLISGSSGNGLNGMIIGKRVSNTTFIPYIVHTGRRLYLLSPTSDSTPEILYSENINTSSTSTDAVLQIDIVSSVLRRTGIGINQTSTDASNMTSNIISYNYSDLIDRIPECDSVLYIPQSGGAGATGVGVMNMSNDISNIAKVSDFVALIINYVSPIVIDKTLYLDNTANFVEPDNDTIIIENQKLTSTCQRQFNTGSSLTMATAMMVGSNGVTLRTQSSSTNSIIPRQCFTVSSVSGTKIDPQITTSASTGITIPSQNSEGNMVLADPYRYIAFSFNPTKDAFISQSYSTTSSRYSRAMLGKMQNDGTFRLLYIQDVQYLYKVSAHNNDGTCDFTYTTFGNGSNNVYTRIMWLDVTNKLMYYIGGGATSISTLYSDSVTDEFINDFCQCDTIIYSPATGASSTSSGLGVLHNIGTSGNLEERLASTTLVQPTETYQKSILTVDTTWLTQFIQDTFGINPQ